MRAHRAKSSLPPALAPPRGKIGRAGDARPELQSGKRQLAGDDGVQPRRGRGGRAEDPTIQSQRVKGMRALESGSPLCHSVRADQPALLLVCGNTLRQDDGVGLRIAEAMEQLFPAARLRIVAAHQFTPEMSAEIAATEVVIFVDARASDEPGAIRVLALAATAGEAEVHRAGSHGLEPAALLGLAKTLCGHAPARAFVVTVGAGCFGYGERLSGELRQAVPRAVRLIANLVEAFGPKV